MALDAGWADTAWIREGEGECTNTRKDSYAHPKLSWTFLAPYVHPIILRPRLIFSLHSLVWLFRSSQLLREQQRTTPCDYIPTIEGLHRNAGNRCWGPEVIASKHDDGGREFETLHPRKTRVLLAQ